MVDKTNRNVRTITRNMDDHSDTIQQHNQWMYRNEQCQQWANESESHQIDILKAYQKATEKFSHSQTNPELQSDKMEKITALLTQVAEILQNPPGRENPDQQGAALLNEVRQLQDKV